MLFSATSMSPPVMVLPGLSCKPTVAIRFEPSSCEKIGWPFSPGDFSLTVDLSALRKLPAHSMLIFIIETKWYAYF